MPHPYHDAFYDVKGDEHYGEDEAFVKDRVNERFIFKPRSKTKVFGSEQDLCKNERIDNRKGVLLIIQMTLREDNALVKRKQSKDDPEIKENHNEALEFFGGPLLQIEMTRRWYALIGHILCLPVYWLWRILLFYSGHIFLISGDAVEALAYWLALGSNGWKRDPRLPGALKLSGKNDLSFATARKRSFYVTQPMRQATVRPLRAACYPCCTQWEGP